MRLIPGSSGLRLCWPFRWRKYCYANIATGLFTEEEDPEYIEQAVTAGISTYLVGSINPQQVKPVINVALAQFKSFQNLRNELNTTRTLELTRFRGHPIL